jgi:large subunit ribosomal protein L25
MDKITLAAQPRTAHGKQAARLRAEGKIPAVAYGHNIKPESLTLEAKDVERAYHLAGGNQMVALKVGDGHAKNALMSDVQREPLKNALIHVDFYLVRMDEMLKAEVPLHFVGESTAVYQGEGTLVKNVETLEVECLPGDLPESVEVDIAVLDDFEKTITVADLALPKGVKLANEEAAELLVAKVEAPRSDEEMAELDEAVGEEVPEGAREEAPVVVSEENEGDKDKGRDKK